jgi:hypothetical protein
MADSKQTDQIIADMRKEEQQRQEGYREKALKLYPHVCARCSREFEGKKLRELTVHHRDHNHDNNPPDGSNWDLLCLYCHDHEHTQNLQEQRSIDGPANRQEKPTLVHSPFAALGDKLKSSR